MTHARRNRLATLSLRRRLPMLLLLFLAALSLTLVLMPPGAGAATTWHFSPRSAEDCTVSAPNRATIQTEAALASTGEAIQSAARTYLSVIDINVSNNFAGAGGGINSKNGTTAGGPYEVVAGLGMVSTPVSFSPTDAKEDQTITFGPLSNKTFGDPDFTVSASASSGLPVSFAASGSCSVNGSTVHITGAGSCTVTASQGGDANFNAAPDVAQSFQIARANQTITFSPLGDRRFGSLDFPVSRIASASSGLGLTYTASGSCTIVNGDTLHITAVGTCSVTASQDGDSNYNAAASVTQSFQVTQVRTFIFPHAVPNPSLVGQEVTLSANVQLDSLSPSSPTAKPTGTVQFQVDGNNVGGPVNCVPVSGFGNYCTADGPSISSLTAGWHGIMYNYSGDANFGASTIQFPLAVAPIIFKFSQSTYTVAERDGSVTITVNRTGDATQAASVDYSTDDDGTPSGNSPCSVAWGVALERCDYTRAAGTLNFAPNETQKSFTVLVNDDSYAEGTETLSLSLSNPSSNAAINEFAITTLQITDDQPESSGNPNDDAQTFVGQHYHDFLNREPDASGLQFWTGGITSCGSDANCREVKRVSTSAAFFLSIEFQQTGYLVERMYKAAFGDATGNSTLAGAHTLKVPVVRLDEFLADTQRTGRDVIVGQGNWQQQLEDNKQAFALEFVQRQRFTSAYPTAMTPAQFVDALFQNAGVTPTAADRNTALGEFGSAADTANTSARAKALRDVAENAAFSQAEFDRAFVLMQYFGYLRRNPNDAPDSDYTGYDFWLSKLNQFGGDFVQAEMVKAFITSAEYRQRFGP
jgi:hypothetical protein